MAPKELGQSPTICSELRVMSPPPALTVVPWCDRYSVNHVELSRRNTMSHWTSLKPLPRPAIYGSILVALCIVALFVQQATWPTALASSEAQSSGGMLTSAATQQHLHSGASAEFPVMLPVVVDGAEAPDRIPMELAYRHLVLSLSRVSSQGDGHLASQLARIKLSPKDSDSMRAALSGIVSELTRLDRATQAADTHLQSEETRMAIREAEHAALDMAASRLRSSLSADGVTKLEEYVSSYVRSRIVIYGDAPAP
jgi:hypothetical protein